MKKLFFADSGFQKEFTRSRACGYKKLVIGDDVKVAEPVSLHTEGDVLMMSPCESTDEEECYTFLCKEFGLVGKTIGLHNKVSVIFLDDGWMLLTLLHGGIILNLEGELRMPIVGDDVPEPRVVTEDILWVDAEKLLGYSPYLRGQFMYDFELVLDVSGEYLNKMTSFSLRELADESIDISLGKYALYLQREENKKSARDARKIYAGVSAPREDFEFDDDEEEPEFSEDD